MVYRGGGRYALAGGKNDSDDEQQLYSKDLFMNFSEDDEEEQIVIINTKNTAEQRHRSEKKIETKQRIEVPLAKTKNLANGIGLLDKLSSEGSSEEDEGNHPSDRKSTRLNSSHT